jgi:hypothetical protein
MAEVKKTGGRKPGVPNKATADARQAIASFVDGNAHRLTEWLDQVASGIKVLNAETGEEKYAVLPNPAKAFDMFQSVVEYHVPKLARMEVGGIEGGSAIKTEDTNADRFLEIIRNMEMTKRAG